MEGKYNKLSQSYTALQNEYVVAKAQLEKLTREESASSWDSPRESVFLGVEYKKDLSSIFFENEVFCFDVGAQQ
jgi:hypothetical protein